MSVSCPLLLGVFFVCFGVQFCFNAFCLFLFFVFGCFVFVVLLLLYGVFCWVFCVIVFCWVFVLGCFFHRLSRRPAIILIDLTVIHKCVSLTVLTLYRCPSD